MLTAHKLNTCGRFNKIPCKLHIRKLVWAMTSRLLTNHATNGKSTASNADGG